MPTQKTYTALIAAIALAAGSAIAVAPKDSKSINPQAITIAAQSLILEPGDAQQMSNALQNPLKFEEVPNERTFTGQLIAHAKPQKKQTAFARISPITVKISNFVEEYVIDVPAGMTENELATMLMATGDYKFVEPNWLLYPMIIPNDSQYASSWQHNRLQSASAWDLHTGNSNIIIAVCDSGVDLDHPDLVDSLVPGFNSANRVAQVDGGNVDDINGHGTFVSGCAAAKGNNNRGVVGVGWDFSIMPIRVTNNTNGTASGFDILEGARWAAENGAQIVNASFSGATSGSNNATGAYLKSLGSLLFWASGNDGTLISPDRPDMVIVGSTTSSDSRSGFSNYGPAVAITAPGSSVRSTRRGGSYGNGSGTSYASPIAAGVGAMIYSVNPSFSADDVQHILYNSVDDLGPAGRDNSFGRGRVNTRQAIELAQTYIPPMLTPIADSFESNSWQDLLVATSGSPDTANPADAPDGSTVLVLDQSDTVETVALAGRSLDDDAVLSFMLKASSIEAGESLAVEYLENPETLPNTWTTIASINGQGLTGSEFVSYDILLPNNYEWHGTKVRFMALGSDASDTWMIDALSINTIEPSVAPLEDHFESNLISGTRWQTVQGAQTAFDANNFFVQLSDASVIESRDVPLDQFGIVPSYIRFDAWTNASVSPADTLLVEVFNISNVWETVATLTGDQLTANPTPIEINMPFTAMAIPDMRLRISAATTGAFHIDNIYVGVDQAATGCNQADIAEPYNSLNFFDVSAFLSAFSLNEPDADINNDGIYNFFDVSDFLSLFNAGCP